VDKLNQRKPPQSVQHDGSGAGSLIQYLDSMTRALKASDVARLLSISRTQAYRLAEDGKIPCFYVGTSVRFDPGIIARWLREKQPA
jgi:excisionase family DNA binding protein